MKFIRITNAWELSELIALDDIKSVTVARNNLQTLIRLKSGGYAIASVHLDDIVSALGNAGAEIF